MSSDAVLSAIFRRFVASERAGGGLLVICSVIALVLANSPASAAYLGWWKTQIGGLSIQAWINDGLMAVFFLLIGLELERELYVGELSHGQAAALPIAMALGGMFVPAFIHFWLNAETTTQIGFGIPVATDIAFALGILSLLGNRIPPSLKILVVAFAAIDDLGAVALIALFYTNDLSLVYLALALGLWGFLCVLNRRMRVMALAPYLAGGVACWCLMLKSGVHPTIAGVLLAFAIPFTPAKRGRQSPSHRLESALQKPVALLVLPLFALANAGVTVSPDGLLQLLSPNSVGIMAGLVIGKPAGIALFGFIAVASGVSRMPRDVRWDHVVGAGLLGGIGFTMSIFVTNLAFAGKDDLISASKMAIFCASLVAGIFGALWLAASARLGRHTQGRALRASGDSFR